MALIKINDTKAQFIMNYLRLKLKTPSNDSGSQTCIAFFSGTIPTSAESAIRGVTRFPSWNQTLRDQYPYLFYSNDSDFLWASITRTSSALQIESADNIELYTEYNPATESGTVSWFSVFQIHDAGGQSNPSAAAGIYQPFLWGTVGTSGTDLIIPSTSILQGKNYRITGLRLDIPGEM